MCHVRIPYVDQEMDIRTFFVTQDREKSIDSVEGAAAQESIDSVMQWSSSPGVHRLSHKFCACFYPSPPFCCAHLWLFIYTNERNFCSSSQSVNHYTLYSNPFINWITNVPLYITKVPPRPGNHCSKNGTHWLCCMVYRCMAFMLGGKLGHEWEMNLYITVLKCTTI